MNARPAEYGSRPAGPSGPDQGVGVGWHTGWVSDGAGTDSGVVWDFFVSYTRSDRAWAEWVAWVLEEAGFRVLVQAWDFPPGSNWVAGMDDGVRRAGRTVAVLSDAYSRSVYGAAEWRAAWAADPAGESCKLLVVRVEDCDRPGLLAQIVSLDLFDRSEDDAHTELVDAAMAAVSGARVKPAAAPPFPAGRAVPERPPFPDPTAGRPVVGPIPSGSQTNVAGRDVYAVQHGTQVFHQTDSTRPDDRPGA